MFATGTRVWIEEIAMFGEVETVSFNVRGEVNACRVRLEGEWEGDDRVDCLPAAICRIPQGTDAAAFSYTEGSA